MLNWIFLAIWWFCIRMWCTSLPTIAPSNPIDKLGQLASKALDSTIKVNVEMAPSYQIHIHQVFEVWRVITVEIICYFTWLMSTLWCKFEELLSLIQFPNNYFNEKIVNIKSVGRVNVDSTQIFIQLLVTKFGRKHCLANQNHMILPLIRRKEIK